MLRCWLVCVFMFCFIIYPTHAQEKHVNRGNQQWFQYIHEIPINEIWSIKNDFNFRWRAQMSSRSQYLLRTNIGFLINEHVRIAGGFAHLGFYVVEQLARLEYRPFQELSIDHEYEKLVTGHRFRIEERFFKALAERKAGEGHNFNFRLRYRFSVSYPLFSIPALHPESKVSFGIADEIFLNAGQSIVYNIFNQNRLLIGPAVQFNDNTEFKITYNNLFASASEPDEYRHLDIIWLGLSHKLDFSGK